MREITEKQLKMVGINYDRLIMRSTPKQRQTVVSAK
jgi:hypothetical protein